MLGLRHHRSKVVLSLPVRSRQECVSLADPEDADRFAARSEGAASRADDDALQQNVYPYEVRHIFEQSPTGTMYI